MSKNKTVDYPKMQSLEEIEPGDYIMSLYQKLGWDKTSELDPTKIVINHDQWLDICAQFNASTDEYTAGYLWMNSGPSADANIPYGKVVIEEGAFEYALDGLTPADKQAIDALLEEYVSSDGKTVMLEADYEETVEPLLSVLYENSDMGKEVALSSFKEAVCDRWETAIGSAIDNTVLEAGIPFQEQERYLDAIDYISSHYSFEPNFDHYLDQEICVNVVLGTNKEMNVDFSSIPELCSQLKWGEDIDVADLDFDNGLGWLLELQGNTPEDLYTCMQDRMSNEVSNPQSVEKHGVFLTTLCEEMVDFSDNMGTVTALCSMSVRDYLELCDPKTVLNLPRRPETGLFSPWEGAGSRLDIVLPDGLHIPHNMRFDMQIEGADCGRYTVNEVYQLLPDAWKPIDSVTRDDARAVTKEAEKVVGKDATQKDAFESVLDAAKTSAAEKNATYDHSVPDKLGHGHEI